MKVAYRRVHIEEVVLLIEVVGQHGVADGPDFFSGEYMVTATHDPRTVLTRMGLAETMISPGLRKAL
jgi:hypothetical protein